MRSFVTQGLVFWGVVVFSLGPVAAVADEGMSQATARSARMTFHKDGWRLGLASGPLAFQTVHRVSESSWSHKTTPRVGFALSLQAMRRWRSRWALDVGVTGERREEDFLGVVGRSHYLLLPVAFRVLGPVGLSIGFGVAPGVRMGPVMRTVESMRIASSREPDLFLGRGEFQAWSSLRWDGGWRVLDGAGLFVEARGALGLISLSRLPGLRQVSRTAAILVGAAWGP